MVTLDWGHQLYLYIFMCVCVCLCVCVIKYQLHSKMPITHLLPILLPPVYIPLVKIIVFWEFPFRLFLPILLHTYTWFAIVFVIWLFPSHEDRFISGRKYLKNIRHLPKLILCQSLATRTEKGSKAEKEDTKCQSYLMKYVLNSKCCLYIYIYNVIFQYKKRCRQYRWHYLPATPLGQDMTQGQFLSGV